MRNHEALTVIERGKASGMTPLQAIREHLGLTRDAVAKIVKFDPKCLAICEDHAGVAMPDVRFRSALARCLGVPAELLFEPKHRAV
jgi:DNA-binding XRE family transcriptional regulator